MELEKNSVINIEGKMTISECLVRISEFYDFRVILKIIEELAHVKSMDDGRIMGMAHTKYTFDDNSFIAVTKAISSFDNCSNPIFPLPE